MPKPLVASTEKLNRYGFRLLMSGGRFDNYRLNPVMLKGHNWDGLSLGKFDIEVKDGQLMATPEFDMDDPEAAKLANKYEKGYMSGLSIGFFPLAFSEDPELMLPGQVHPTVTEWELVEISCVSVPADAGAARLYAKKDDGSYELLSADRLQLAFPSTQNTEQMKLTLKDLMGLLGLDANATKEQAEQAINKLKSPEPTTPDFSGMAALLGLEKPEEATETDCTAKVVELTATLSDTVEKLEVANTQRVSVNEILLKAKQVGKAAASLPNTALGGDADQGTDDPKALAQEYYNLSINKKGEGLRSLKAENPELYGKMLQAYVDHNASVNK